MSFGSDQAEVALTGEVELVPDGSPANRRARLYLEGLLRRARSTGGDPRRVSGREAHPASFSLHSIRPAAPGPGSGQTHPSLYTDNLTYAQEALLELTQGGAEPGADPAGHPEGGTFTLPATEELCTTLSCQPPTGEDLCEIRLLAEAARVRVGCRGASGPVWREGGAKEWTLAQLVVPLAVLTSRFYPEGRVPVLQVSRGLAPGERGFLFQATGGGDQPAAWFAVLLGPRRLRHLVPLERVLETTNLGCPLQPSASVAIAHIRERLPEAFELARIYARSLWERSEPVAAPLAQVLRVGAWVRAELAMLEPLERDLSPRAAEVFREGKSLLDQWSRALEDLASPSASERNNGRTAPHGHQLRVVAALAGP